MGHREKKISNCLSIFDALNAKLQSVKLVAFFLGTPGRIFLNRKKMGEIEIVISMLVKHLPAENWTSHA